MLNKKKKKNNVLFITAVGLLSALSIALLFMLPGISIFPAAPFLKYELMDIPMLIAGMTLGPAGGALVLLIGCALQSLLFGEGGVPGFFMHVIASGSLVLVSSLIYRKSKSTSSMLIGLILGSLCMTAIMIPLNFIITVHWYGVPLEMVKAAMLPAIIPFNLIKAGLNSAITFALVMVLKPIIKHLTEKIERKSKKAT